MSVVTTLSSYLNEVLALGLRDERLELGSGEGVDETGLGHDEKKHLGAGEDRELVCLRECVSWLRRRVEKLILRCNALTQRVLCESWAGAWRCWKLTFFMIPAFRLEKVIWRRDLS